MPEITASDLSCRIGFRDFVCADYCSRIGLLACQGAHCCAEWRLMRALAIAVRTFLPVLARRAFHVSLHELRESVDCAVAALMRYVMIAELGAAEQIHGV